MKEIINIWGSVILFAICLITMAFPDDSIGQIFNQKSNLILLGYAVLCIVFLVSSQKRLLLTSFICTGLLAFYLKVNTNHQIKLKGDKNEISFSVANITMSDISEAPFLSITSVAETEPDVIFFQELDPIWSEKIIDVFGSHYPYSVKMIPQNDFVGTMAIMKNKAIMVDSNALVNDQIISFLYPVMNTNINLINSYLPLNFKEKSDSTINTYISQLQSSTLGGPIIFSGELNAVQWASITNRIKSSLKLSDGQIFHPLKSLTDQVFYSQEFSPINYRIMNTANNTHFGILAQFELEIQ